MPAATGEDVRATTKKRAPCSAKYAVHLMVPASPPYKEAATVVGPRHVATYAHEDHLSWQSLRSQVAVHCPDEDRRTHVDATVVYHDKDKDVVILEVQRELAAPVLDTAISAGDMYYVHGHGQSTAAQEADATSISHGRVAATELDALSHRGDIRGDMTWGKGDYSGGGCFSVAGHRQAHGPGGRVGCNHQEGHPGAHRGHQQHPDGPGSAATAPGAASGMRSLLTWRLQTARPVLPVPRAQAALCVFTAWAKAVKAQVGSARGARHAAEGVGVAAAQSLAARPSHVRGGVRGGGVV
ncbi:hypothetical protein HYH02_014454 [Chlamydomonas schloesseri]|uniref:Uncharacterized protein n=1 Tax=Chlamydomonas schloesseri TaxID=2026947 RepID=A0A835SY95_9CHLO|nr:hypothetical protein HYH02_014454 [Chlamydomonas schloesseri]|eukprot:KAG2428106.1 hypothetical protein HYH02_014454 [Chlamydomonas schloesseri]